MKKKSGFYTETAPVLDPTIPCLGRDKPYTGTETEFQKSSAGVIAVYGLDLAFHCPNETRGKKSKPGEAKTAADINRMMLAGQGVRPGVTDWCIPHPTAFGHPGAFIELKVKKGSLSHDQIRYMNKAKSFGYYVAAIWNLDEFETVVKTLWPRIRPGFKPPTQIGEYVHTSPTNMAEFDAGTIAGLNKTGSDPKPDALLSILKERYPADTKQGRTIRKIEAVLSSVTDFAKALNQFDADAIENVIWGLDSALAQIQRKAGQFNSGGIVGESTNTSNWCHGFPAPSDPETVTVTVIDFADPDHVAIAKTLTSSSIVRVLNNPFRVGEEVPPEFDEMYAEYDYTNVPFWLDALDLLVYGHRGNPIPDQKVCDHMTHQYITYLRLRP